jgi:hypothetical protein
LPDYFQPVGSKLDFIGPTDLAVSEALVGCTRIFTEDTISEFGNQLAASLEGQYSPGENRIVGTDWQRLGGNYFANTSLALHLNTAWNTETASNVAPSVEVTRAFCKTDEVGNARSRSFYTTIYKPDHINNNWAISSRQIARGTSDQSLSYSRAVLTDGSIVHSLGMANDGDGIRRTDHLNISKLAGSDRIKVASQHVEHSIPTSNDTDCWPTFFLASSDASGIEVTVDWNGELSSQGKGGFDSSKAANVLAHIIGPDGFGLFMDKDEALNFVGEQERRRVPANQMDQCANRLIYRIYTEMREIIESLKD